MKQIIVVLFLAITLVSCAETWTGVKKDTKTITRSVGDATNELADKIGETLGDDKEKEAEE